jgi:hypothetical protein
LCTQMQTSVDKNVQEPLERFLSWLLDARWFPETDRDEKKRLKGELRTVRRIVKRMEAFSQGIPDIRLQQGLTGWKSYESTLATLAKQQLRTAPHISTGGSERGSPEIAERLMCAVLIIRKLHSQGNAYDEVQRLLADPDLLPYPITTSEETIQELRAGTLRRPPTGYELYCVPHGRNIPMRRYTRSVKALQSSVARLEKEFQADKSSAQLVILHRLYAEYLWSQKLQAGFSDDEATMLRTLVSAEVDGRGGGGGSVVSGK